MLVSCSALAGLWAVQAGYAFMDPLIALFIAGVIAWTAYVVINDVLTSLTDAARLAPMKSGEL